MDATTIHITIAAIGFGSSVVGVYVAFKVLEYRMKTAEAEILGLRESRHHTAELVAGLQAEVLRLRRGH